MRFIASFEEMLKHSTHPIQFAAASASAARSSITPAGNHLPRVLRGANWYNNLVVSPCMLSLVTTVWIPQAITRIFVTFFVAPIHRSCSTRTVCIILLAAYVCIIKRFCNLPITESSRHIALTVTHIATLHLSSLPNQCYPMPFHYYTYYVHNRTSPSMKASSL